MQKYENYFDSKDQSLGKQIKWQFRYVFNKSLNKINEEALQKPNEIIEINESMCDNQQNNCN